MGRGGSSDDGLPPLFPQLSADDVLASTRRHWNIDGPLPVPVGDWLACPLCRHTVVQARWWRWHVRSGRPTLAGRCDVSFKCCGCAYVWVHGVAVPSSIYEERSPRVSDRKIHWRQAMKLLEGD